MGDKGLITGTAEVCAGFPVREILREWTVMGSMDTFPGQKRDVGHEQEEKYFIMNYSMGKVWGLVINNIHILSHIFELLIFSQKMYNESH